MSKERLEHENDPLVSAGYRDLATERTPESLDNAVLKKARANARPKYGRLRLWVRPLAWAATVAISLAIVLQVTQVPDPAPPAAEPWLPATTSDDVDAIVKESPVQEEARPAGRLDRPAAESAGALVPTSVDALREAEDMARMRSGSADEVALTAASDAPAALQKKDQPRYCDEEARATVDSWLECIEQLEADGKLAEARAERLVFEESQPDF